jgi:hypothetical protein
VREREGERERDRERVRERDREGEGEGEGEGGRERETVLACQSLGVQHYLEHVSQHLRYERGRGCGAVREVWGGVDFWSRV